MRAGPKEQDLSSPLLGRPRFFVLRDSKSPPPVSDANFTAESQFVPIRKFQNSFECVDNAKIFGQIVQNHPEPYPVDGNPERTHYVSAPTDGANHLPGLGPSTGMSGAMTHDLPKHT
jgi:hypothetical protein